MKYKLICAGLLMAGMSGAAQANFLSDEWKNFRTHPRLEKAYQLFKKQQYGEAKKLLEEILPRNLKVHSNDSEVACARELVLRFDFNFSLRTYLMHLF